MSKESLKKKIAEINAKPAKFIDGMNVRAIQIKNAILSEECEILSKKASP